MLVFTDTHIRFLALARHHNCHEFFIVETISLSSSVLGLAFSGKIIHLLAAQLELAGQIISCLRHGICTELVLDFWVWETRAERTLETWKGFCKSCLCLADHEGRACHAFNATGNNQVALTASDSMSRRNYCVHSRATVALHDTAWNFDR